MSISAQNGADHVRESNQLDMLAYTELFMIEMKPRTGPVQTLFLTAQKAVTWQGKVWESVPISLMGYGQNSSGEQNRPKLSILNPNGVFTKYVHSGLTDNALVTRYRVLSSHLAANINSYVKNVWRVSKPLAVGQGAASFELRGSLDGQNFLIPGRSFMPPKFPHVSL